MKKLIPGLILSLLMVSGVLASPAGMAIFSARGGTVDLVQGLDTLNVDTVSFSGYTYSGPSGHVGLYISGTTEEVQDYHYRVKGGWETVTRTRTVPVTISAVNGWGVQQCWSMNSARVYCEAEGTRFQVKVGTHMSQRMDLDSFRYDIYDSDGNGIPDKVNLAGGVNPSDSSVFRVTGMEVTKLRLR